MARKKDLKAAKVAKQKKIVIVGSVLFIALLGFQVPRTLKVMQHKRPVYHHKSTTAYVQTTPGATTGTTTSTGTPATTAPVSSTSEAPVLTAQLAPPAREGQLSVLSASFKSKDPFHQLIAEDSGSSSSTTTDMSTTTNTTSVTKQAASLKVVPSAKPAPAAAPTPTAPAAPAAPTVRKITLPFLSAVISVNGDRQGVDVKVDFPTDTPLFHLISLTKKTAKVSVSGGSLESGKATLTLHRGKPLTLVNTADGTRFRLVLVSTSTTAAAKPAPVAAPSGETAAPAAPTQTTTTETPTIGG